MWASPGPATPAGALLTMADSKCHGPSLGGPARCGRPPPFSCCHREPPLPCPPDPGLARASRAFGPGALKPVFSLRDEGVAECSFSRCQPLPGVLCLSLDIGMGPSLDREPWVGPPRGPLRPGVSPVSF